MPGEEAEEEADEWDPPEGDEGIPPRPPPPSLSPAAAAAADDAAAADACACELALAAAVVVPLALPRAAPIPSQLKSHADSEGATPPSVGSPAPPAWLPFRLELLLMALRELMCGGGGGEGGYGRQAGRCTTGKQAGRWEIRQKEGWQTKRPANGWARELGGKGRQQEWDQTCPQLAVDVYQCKTHALPPHPLLCV